MEAEATACRAEGNAREVAFLTASRQGVVECARPQAVNQQTVDIDIGDEQLLLAVEPLRLRQDVAVLRDQAMPAEDHVGGRFVDSTRRIDIARHAAARLVADQLPAVSRLANDL